MPSTTRSKVQYAPAASRSAQKTKIEARRAPPSAQPIRPNRAASASTSSQDLAMLRAATGPVLVLRSVAAARAVKRRNVLKGDEDVAVQLDVRDLVDVAVRGQHAFLVLAAEQRDLDLLALVLARVVLHRSERSQLRITK